jgi:hypothetical protein
MRWTLYDQHWPENKVLADGPQTEFPNRLPRPSQQRILQYSRYYAHWMGCMESQKELQTECTGEMSVLSEEYRLK